MERDKKMEHVLASPVTSELLLTIYHGKKKQEELNEQFKQFAGSKSVLDYHLRSLIKRNLVEIDNNGVYSITNDGRSIAEDVLRASRAAEEIVV